MSITIHVLVDCQNVVGWHLTLKYMRTPPTHYFVESSGRAAYMETHPYSVIYLNRTPEFEWRVLRLDLRT